MRNLEAAKLSDSKGFRKYSARGSEEQKIPVLSSQVLLNLALRFRIPRGPVFSKHLITVSTRPEGNLY